MFKIPKWLNTNLLHNILNVSMAVIGSLELIDLAPLVGVENSLKIITGMAIAKLVINLVRDGIAGLAKDQPPVQ